MNVGPVLRIDMELESMKASIAHLLADRQEEVNAMLQEELDKVLTSDSLRAHIKDATRLIIEGAITKDLNAYYMYGEGREVIHKAMVDQLGRGFAGEEE